MWRCYCHAGRGNASVTNPRFRVSARHPHLHHPTWLGERKDVTPLPTVWTSPASGHAEQLYSTCWCPSPCHQLQPMTNGSSHSNDSRRLSQLQDANAGLCHYRGLSPAIPNLRSLHKWQFNPDATWCHNNELLSCVVDSHITKPLSALIVDHHV